MRPPALRAILRRPPRRVARRLSAAAAALSVLALALAAWAYEGIPQAEVDLNDGAVWVTSTDQHLVARLNTRSRQIDGEIRTTSASFDVTQSGQNVLVPDTAASSVASVDPTTVTLSQSAQLTSGAVVAQGADRVIAVNAAEGTVRAAAVPAVASLPAAAPLLANMPGAVAVVGVDGSVHAASPANGAIVTVPVDGQGWAEPVTRPGRLSAGTDVAVTAVGRDTVVLERGTGTVHLPGGTDVDLGEPGLALQQPGPESDSVLLASRTALITVGLDDGRVTSVPASEGTPAPGVAAQPVRLGGCAYAAWSGSGQYVRQCGSERTTVHDDALGSAGAPVFRVNRDAIVINDVVTGGVWLPDEQLVLVEDWTDVTSQTDEDSDTEDDSARTSDSQSQPERTDENHAPEAVDDAFGVRPGRSTVLPVLANDSDPDGDVLTAAPVGRPSNAAVAVAQDGLALRLDVPDDAAGTISVPYTADDGRGLSDSATATVEVHPWEVNSAPEQLMTPTVTVSGTASASLSVLGSWQDPDGDTAYLVSAQGEGLDVRTTNEGVVTVRDLQGAPGTRELTVVVSDGRQTASGTVTVDVRAADAQTPVANADHVRVVAGSQTVVSPLDNDSSPSGEALSLAAIEQTPEGTSATLDRRAGTFTFSAEAAGTYYLDYDVAAGAAVAKGIVRVDVVEPAEASVPPVTENDTALLREGGAVTIAPLSNDFDPTGGILVLQSATAPAESGVSVTVVDHSLLQITSAGPLSQGLDIEYTVSNGEPTSIGRVTVVPVSAGQVQVPVAGPDTAVVRVGDVVTVPVLDNDTSPSGLTLSVGQDLETVGGSLGTAWVSEDSVRFKAGETPGRTTLSYTAVDSEGQTSSAPIEIEVRARDDEANSAPVPRPLEASTVGGSPVTIRVPLEGADPDGDSVSLVGLGQAPPAHGTVTSDGARLVYTPTGAATGTDTFTYTVQDRFGAQATGTVRVGVAPAPTTNAAPVATDDLVTAQPGRTVAAEVLANDLDADGDALSLVGTPTCDDDALTLSVRANRVMAVLPQTEGLYTVHYTVTDSRGGTDVGTLTIRVTAQAPPVSPVGVDDHVTVDQVAADGTVTVPVLDNDKDADGSPWDLTVTADDPRAQVTDQSIRATIGEEQYLVLYTVTDVDGRTGSAVVVVPARSELRPRVDSSQVPVRIPAGQTSEVELSSYVLTRAGTTPVVADASTLNAGTGLDSVRAGDSGRSLSATPTAGFTGQSSITLAVADGTGSDALSSTITLPVLVVSTTNTPPVITPTEVTVAPGEPAVTADLAAMTRDADSDPLVFTAGAAPEGFSTSVSGSTLSVSAADDAVPGTAGSLEVRVEDGTNAAVTATLPLRVVASTRPRMTAAPTTLVSDGSPVSVDVATLVTNPFPGRPITLSREPQVTSGAGSVTAAGTTLTIAPESGFTGRLVVSYEALDATGSASRAVVGTVTVTVASPPDAPTGVRAAPSGASAMAVSWSPGADHGSPITSYIVTETGGAGTWTCTASPCRADGLATGGTYSFRVVAVNGAGRSAPSAPSAPTALEATPDAPVVTPDPNGRARATWSAVSVEGATVTYEAQLLRDGQTVNSYTGPATEASFGNAQPGGYTVRVRALVEGGGASPWSTAGLNVFGAPGAPGTPSIQYDGSALRISWSPAPANGAAVTYAVSVTGAISRSQTTSDTSLTVPAGGLGPGSHSVSVTVTPSNAAGSGTASSGSHEFTVTGKPLPPSTPGAEATGVNGQIKVTSRSTPVGGNGWSADDLDIEYRVVSGGDVVQDWTSERTFSGLTDGAPYTVQARAVDEDEDDTASDLVSSGTVTPYGPPSEPSVSCSAQGGGVSCTWTAGATGGRPTTYQGDTSRNEHAPQVEASGTRSFSPGAGNKVTWCVRARNDAGQTSDWECSSATAGPRVAVGTEKSFPIITDIDEAPEARCTPQDVDDTGWSPSVCRRLVIDASGFNPDSTVQCGYRYSEPGGGSWYEESFTVDSDGAARHRFPHRVDAGRVPPSYSITCTQQ